MMRDLSVSALVFFVIELVLFALLWFGQTSLTATAAVLHLVTAAAAAQWLSMRWANSAVSQKQVWIFVAISILLLPVIGALMLVIVDNRQLLREQGIRAGIGTDNIKKPSAKDLLNYFSAPDHHQKGSIRKTRDLLSSLDDEAYLGLLIASRHLPDKEAYALLSEALLSPFESARLMAYSLKGKLEERMQETLESKLDALKTGTRHTPELHLAIAHDYLHLFQVGVESTSKEVLLQNAREHCITALKSDSSAVSAYQTLSEVLHFQGNIPASKRALQRALHLKQAETAATSIAA